MGERCLHLYHLTSHLRRRGMVRSKNTWMKRIYTCFRMVWMYEYLPCLPLFLNRLCIVLLAVCR